MKRVGEFARAKRISRGRVYELVRAGALPAQVLDDGSVLLKAAIAHAQFETIHPFVDGNGRTGRALIHTILKRDGITDRAVLPISTVFSTAKDHYIAGLTAFRETPRSWICGCVSSGRQRCEPPRTSSS